ncbi:hypothetical protein JHW33_07550 [Rahnella aceris]|jgi:hypothetical protein|uniref:hypothetical protein n=1 Tax=Rahnella sp. (strain Y9602) TaxID=2703885 RepID=UPI00190648FD|nr:hypothetical protein [Rahnella aceris]QQN36466.1 hypothetical protein JHW33_07550 [Rahnella aceris]
MKLNKSKLALCLLAASTVSVSFMSHAAGTFSDVSTETVTITVSPATGSSILSLVGQTLPAAGTVSDGTVVAIATNSVAGQGKARSGIRYTPNIGTQVVDAISMDKVVLHGDGDAVSHTLSLAFLNPADAADWVDVKGDTYYVTNDEVDSQTINIATSGAQTIAADNYKLSMDGVVYHQ